MLQQVIRMRKSITYFSVLSNLDEFVPKGKDSIICISIFSVDLSSNPNQLDDEKYNGGILNGCTFPYIIDFLNNLLNKILVFISFFPLATA